MRKKILYITHIAWGWIKQRPQFLAEGLSKEYDIDVYFRMSNHLKGIYNNFLSDNLNIRIKGFRNLPLERIPFLPLKSSYYINKLLWKKEGVSLKDYDYIWITDPLLWWQLPLKNYRGKVIYDCMDDLLSFPYYERYSKLISFIEIQEKRMLQKADYVFCSAETLVDKLKERYHVNRAYNIVNNAITETIFSYVDNGETILPPNSLVYIGTISEWFDFKLILSALDKYKNIHFVLYGPLRTSNLPQHERLLYMGTIDHSKILEVMNASVGLVMPFIVNELILSVNPVKLYEYIYSGKPIAAVRYPESEKFKDYVTLYSDKDEFYGFIEDEILRLSIMNKDAMKEFAKQNTWEARCDQIAKIIS